MSELVALVHVERHRQRRGFGGQIVVQNGEGSCEYRLRIFNHPDFEDVVPDGAEPDWTGFKLEITRGSKRRRETVVEREGELAEDPHYDESGPMLEQAAQQLLLQVSVAGVRALVAARRERLTTTLQSGDKADNLPKSTDVRVPIEADRWQQVTGDFASLVFYLLAPDVCWRR